MATDQPEPTARDREVARAILGHSMSQPHATRLETGQHMELVAAIATALATVRAEERERAAALCDHEVNHPSDLWEEAGCWAHAAENCAAAIRRGDAAEPGAGCESKPPPSTYADAICAHLGIKRGDRG